MAAEDEMSTMPVTTPLTTLAELAVTLPAASRVFHRNRLDFCCHGKRPLADACAERGLDPALILAAIAEEERTAPMPRLDALALPELVEFIVSHYHQRLRAELPELVALAHKVESVHADKPSCPRGLHQHLVRIHEEVLDHLAKEETILFPMIVAGRGRMAGAPIHVMELEHEDHGRNLEQIRALSADLVAPAEACTTWRALYLRLVALEAELMEHIHLENNLLFPRALNG
jgi:regulator of cell morphogenesis and NO signaling